MISRFSMGFSWDLDGKVFMITCWKDLSGLQIHRNAMMLFHV